MNHWRWLKITIPLIAIFVGSVIIFNIFVDTYGVYMCLFDIKKKERFGTNFNIRELNQHIFNNEYIYRNPTKFDSFLFGSSRTGVIDTKKISSGNFFNMSYSAGLPFEHLSIIKTFLKKGIKIKNIIIGLDEFCFTVNPLDHEQHLLRVMHPDVYGRNRVEIFFTYFFRIPILLELSDGLKKISNKPNDRNFKLNEYGLNMGWAKYENLLPKTIQSSVADESFSYIPKIYDDDRVQEAFNAIKETITVARDNNIPLIIFINPISYKTYIKNADSLFPIKRKLASLTDYYDFSGINSVTKSSNCYYPDGDHYRYFVGDMIIKKIFNDGNINVPRDFGVLVTAKNIDDHIKKQKQELRKYKVINRQ